MISFKNDYSEGCHPNILAALAKSNLEQHEGYGDDFYSKEARGRIKQLLNNAESEIYFTSGGTQANLLVIASALRAHESVLAAKTGHINVHEAGAIEATGHRIDYVDSPDGKLYPDDLENLLNSFEDHHMVKPAMVYISNSTELGTIYRKDELTALNRFCKKNNLLLFMDGARLGSALCSVKNNISFADLAQLTDAFYIGGTKNGALLGEAIVINNVHLQADFLYHLKQRGALLAKGKILGIQFYELFANNLFFQLAEHANKMAGLMQTAIEKSGYGFVAEPCTNQLFPILPNELIKKLSEKFGFYIWRKYNNGTSSIRLVTSWATREEWVAEFVAELGS